MTWYEELAKPSWAPPAATFGTVWSILYPIIIIAYGYVAYRALAGEIPRAVLVPIGINVVANLAFTPIQFGLRNLPLASLDIVVVLVTIVWSMAVIWPHVRWATVALVPYLVWVCIATVLQLSITWLNR
ncbi:MAG: TspO/MBR family protein [Coriobacteriia bacterium]|nr:TspO/MBR family protein [Coriobacteriia bacterium]